MNLSCDQHDFVTNKIATCSLVPGFNPRLDRGLWIVLLRRSFAATPLTAPEVLHFSEFLTYRIEVDVVLQRTRQIATVDLLRNVGSGNCLLLD